MTRSPTMNDVARVAGVALKTVSRYINGETNIRPDLAERIAQAISTLGYRRNLAAASIRPGWTSRVLGLIISDLANPYYSTLTRAIEEYAREHGYMLISASSDENGARHDAIVDRLLEQRVDGLLIVPPRTPGRDWADVPPPLPPIVFLDRPGSLAGADAVVADNVAGARTATQALLEAGARRIAFVGDDLSISTMSERFEGFRMALEEFGLSPDPRLLTASAHSSDQAEAEIRRLLMETNVDGIFAANNRSSVGALLAFREHRRVPLIGFDDFETAILSEPAVSVVSHDIAEMGRRATEILVQRLKGDTSKPELDVLPTRLLLRGSEIAAS